MPGNGRKGTRVHFLELQEGIKWLHPTLDVGHEPKGKMQAEEDKEQHEWIGVHSHPSMIDSGKDIINASKRSFSNEKTRSAPRIPESEQPILLSSTWAR